MMGRTRRLSRPLLVLLPAAAILLAVLGLILAAELDRPTARSERGPGVFRVLPGSSLRVVAEALADSGWVRRPRLIAWWGARRGLDRSVMPGRYKLPRGASPRELIERIVEGRVETTRITIAEGLREEQILALVADSLEVDPADVRAAAADCAWMRSLGIPRCRLEGYLFPETYLFPKEYPARSAFERMVREADRRFDASMLRRAEALGWSRDRVVILASIVQGEAARLTEMPRIAAVFHRRLRMGWKLEADPTVRYALGRFAGPIAYADLDVESDYNTYRRPDLPPAPIGNPGDAALRAVLWPDSTGDEMFFVARGDGSHAFSRTLAEHNRARMLFRSLQRSP